MIQSGEIVVSGAREHNLKDLHLRLPRNALVVITGLSGSGKSSLAFDTIYAEGQRRYVESLSAYARQFLGQMDKPDVDSIEGLSPAISIDQKTTSRNPRSTVGTVTEIYDYLRLLWARVGHPHCYNCGRPIEAQSAEQIIDQVMTLPEGTKFMVLAPIVRGRKGEYGKLFEELREQGFTRVKVDGELRRLEEEIVLDKKYKHDIAVVIDRLVMRPDLRKRLADSIETAVARAEGLVDVEHVDTGEVTTYSDRFMCLHCGTSMPELEPRMFSFNSPHGACPRCTGLGSQMEIDPELIVPDPSLTLNDGAILPWSTSASNYYEQMTAAIADKWEVDMDTPWEDLPEDVRHCFLYGTNGEKIYVSYRNRYGRRRSYMTTFEGIVRNLERRYRETDSDWSREKIEEYMTLRPCPECQGRAAAARVAGGQGRRARRARVHAPVGAARDRLARAARAVRHRAPDRAADPARDRRAAALPRQRRRRLPVARARGGHAVRRRGPAHPAGHPDRLVAGGRALHPRRAVDRPAPARQRAPDRDARAAARPRQHRDRGRARRGHDARGRPPRRPRPGRRRARRRAGRRGHARARDAHQGLAHRRSSCRARARSPPRRSGAGRTATSRSRAPRSTTCATST